MENWVIDLEKYLRTSFESNFLCSKVLLYLKKNYVLMLLCANTVWWPGPQWWHYASVFVHFEAGFCQHLPEPQAVRLLKHRYVLLIFVIQFTGNIESLFLITKVLSHSKNVFILKKTPKTKPFVTMMSQNTGVASHDQIAIHR